MSFGVGFIKLASCRADVVWLQEVFLMQTSAAWEGLGGKQRTRSPNLTPSVGQRKGWNSTPRIRNSEIDRDSLSEHWNREARRPPSWMPGLLFPVCATLRTLAQRGRARVWEVVDYRGSIRQTWVLTLLRSKWQWVTYSSVPQGFFLHLQNGSNNS